jgi:molybdopterin converting factor small subunit
VIRVKALGVAKSLIGDSIDIDVAEGTSVRDLLALLPKAIGEMANRNELSIMVGGADVSARDGLATELHQGDEVIVLPFAHGGGP